MMDLKSMERKDLQSLCKQHGIPANTSNLAMIESLSAVLQVEEKVGAKRKGCLRGSGGSSGDDLGKKTVTFLLEGGEESDFEFVEKSKRRRMSGVVVAGRRRGSEGSESERGVGGRRTRSRGLGEMVVWSPVVGKTKAVEQVEGVRRNVVEEEIGATRSLRNREVVGDKSRKGSVKRKANGKGENVEEVPLRSRSANSEEVLGDGDGDVGRWKKRRKKDVDVVSGKGVGKEVVMEPTRRSTRNSSNVVDDGTSSEMRRESVKEKSKLGKEVKGSEDVALVPTRRATRSSATLSEDGTSSSIVEKPVKGGEAIRKGRRHKQGIVSAPKADIEAVTGPVRRTTRSSSTFVEDGTSLTVSEKLVSEGKTIKKGKSQKQGKVPASVLNSVSVVEPVRRTTRTSSTLVEGVTFLPTQVAKRVKSRKQGKAAVSLADTEVIIEPTRRMTRNSSTLVEDGASLVTKVAKKAKSEKQAKGRALARGDSIASLPGNESVTEPIRRSTRSSSKSSEGETTSASKQGYKEAAAVITPGRRSTKSSLKLSEGATTSGRKSTWSSLKLAAGETSSVLRQGDKEEAATISGRRQTRSYLKLSEGEISSVSKLEDKEEAATKSGKRSTRSSSKLSEGDTKHTTELGDKQEAMTTSGKRSRRRFSKFLESEASSVTKLGDKEEAVHIPEWRSTRSSSKLLEDVSSVPLLSSDNNSVWKDQSGKQATNRALKSGDLKAPLLEATTSSTTTRKSMRSSKQQDLTAASPVNEAVSTVTRRATRGSSKGLVDASATSAVRRDKSEKKAMKSASKGSSQAPSSPVIEAVTTPTRSTPSSLNLSEGETLLEVEKLGDESSASLLYSPTVTESTRTTRRSSIWNMFKSPSVCVEVDDGGESVQKIKYGGQTSLHSSGGRPANDSILSSEVERVYGEAQGNSASNKSETRSATTIGFRGKENESDTIEMPVEGMVECMSNTEPTDAVRNLPQDNEYCPSNLPKVSCKITEERSSGDCSNVKLSPNSSSETLEQVEIGVENLCSLHLSVGSEENMPMSGIEAPAVLGNEGSTEQEDIIPDREDTRYLAEQQRDTTSAALDVNSVDSSHKSIEPEVIKQLDEDTDVTPDTTTTVNFNIGSGESLEFIEVVGEVMENVESRIESHDDGEDTRYLAEQQRDTTSAALDVNSVDSSHKSIESEAMKQLDEDTDVTPDITATVNFSIGSGESLEFIEVVGEAMENVESRIERHDDGEDTRYLAEQQRDTTSAVLDVNSVDSSHKSVEPEAMKQLDEDTDVTPDITTTVNFNIGSGESLEFIEVVGEAMENVESRIERHDGTSMKKADEIILDKFDHSDEVEEKKDDGVETVEDEREATTVPISPSESPALGLIFGDQLTENFAQSSPEMIMDNATTGGFHGNEYESDTIEMSVEGRDVSIHDIESPNVERSLPKDNEHYPSHLTEAPCEIIEEMSSGDCRNVIISPHWSSEPLKKQVEFDVENLPTVHKSVGPEENMTMGGIEAPAILGNEGSTEQEDVIAADDEHARNLSEHQIDITSASLNVDSVGSSPKSMEHKAMEQLNEVTVVSLDTTTTANFDIGSQGSIALDQVIGEDVASNAGQERILQMENSPPTLNENVQSFMKIDDEVVEVVDIKGALEETQNSEEFQTSVTPFPQADSQEGEVTESPTFNKEGFSATTGLANLSPQFDAKSNDENEVVVLSTSNAHEELDVRKEVQKDIAEVSPLNHECLSEAKVMIPADASECKEAGKEEASILGSVNLVDKYDEGNFTAALESTVENADNASTKDQNKNSDLDADQPLVGRQREIGSCIRESMSTVVTGQAEKQMDIFLSQLDCKTEADDDATEYRKSSETKLDLRGSEVTAGSKSIYGIDITGGGDISEDTNCGDKFESIERTSNVTEAWDEPGASAMFVNELFHIDSEVAGFANNNSQVGQWECRFQEENFGRSERESFMEVSTSEALATREDEHMSSSSFEHYLRMDYHDSGVIPLEKNLSQELNDVNENEEQFKLQEQRTTIQEASDVSQLTKDGMVSVSDCSKRDGRLEESTLVEQERVRPYINESEDSEPGKAFFTSQNALISSDVATGRSGSTSKIQESEANKKYFEDFCWSGSDPLPEDSLKSTTDVNKE